jgi:hypothetical protein
LKISWSPVFALTVTQEADSAASLQAVGHHNAQTASLKSDVDGLFTSADAFDGNTFSAELDYISSAVYEYATSAAVESSSTPEINPYRSVDEKIDVSARKLVIRSKAEAEIVRNKNGGRGDPRDVTSGGKRRKTFLGQSVMATSGSTSGDRLSIPATWNPFSVKTRRMSRTRGWRKTPTFPSATATAMPLLATSSGKFGRRDDDFDFRLPAQEALRADNVSSSAAVASSGGSATRSG